MKKRKTSLIKEKRNEKSKQEDLLRLDAKTDPLLAKLWDNVRDAAYDRILHGGSTNEAL